MDLDFLEYKILKSRGSSHTHIQQTTLIYVFIFKMHSDLILEMLQNEKYIFEVRKFGILS